MSYFIRAFCRSDRSPAFSELQALMKEKDPQYVLEAEVDGNMHAWTDFEFYYKVDKLPLLVEINWCEEDGSLGKEELEETLEAIGSPGLSLKKRKVISYLKHTKYIVCVQIPTSDADDDGFIANDHLMNFLANNYQAMIHADNEGYYKKDNTLLLKAT